MKKLICMILALIMVMSLCACGTAADDKKDETSGMKDTTSATEKEESNPTPALTTEVEMWLERIPGEYLGFNNMGSEPTFPSFTLNADKTCTFGDGSYTWDIAVAYQDGTYNCDEESAEVYIYDGETRVYKLSLRLHEEDYISTDLYTVHTHGTSGNHDKYYNMSDIEVVEITLDNWADYFAELERITTSKDAFGDITSMNIYNYIALKEECGYGIAPISDVIVEYSCVKEQRKITADLENLTYQWGETIRTTPAGTYTFAMGNHEFEETEEEHYGFLPCISYSYVDKFPEDEATAYTSVETLRITGTLYYVPAK